MGICVATITLPAISIWSVAVAPNGYCAWQYVRIFTRKQPRFTSDADILEREEKVSSAAIPQQTIGAISKQKLPGLEAPKGKGYPFWTMLI
jgi:phospholipase A-2-activating protein